MARKPPAHPPLQSPRCAECGCTSRLVSGREIYPRHPHLHEKRLWRCVACPDAYVGCHEGGDGTDALGRPAGSHLRGARGKLHALLDPLWRNAHESGVYANHDHTGKFQIRSSARVRVYAYLAHHMSLDVDDCHIAHFNIDQCREAWRVLSGVSYAQIRDWWKSTES